MKTMCNYSFTKKKSLFPNGPLKLEFGILVGTLNKCANLTYNFIPNDLK
jgi:hypothetical protein